MKADASNHGTFPSSDPAQLYDDEKDRKKHIAYMTSIAAEEHRDISEVAPFYEQVLYDLRGCARVHDYLNVFVAKRVIERLRGYP